MSLKYLKYFKENANFEDIQDIKDLLFSISEIDFESYSYKRGDKSNKSEMLIFWSFEMIGDEDDFLNYLLKGDLYKNYGVSVFNIILANDFTFIIFKVGDYKFSDRIDSFNLKYSMLNSTQIELAQWPPTLLMFQKLEKYLEKESSLFGVNIKHGIRLLDGSKSDLQGRQCSTMNRHWNNGLNHIS